MNADQQTLRRKLVSVPVRQQSRKQRTLSHKIAIRSRWLARSGEFRASSILAPFEAEIRARALAWAKAA